MVLGIGRELQIHPNLFVNPLHSEHIPDQKNHTNYA